MVNLQNSFNLRLNILTNIMDIPIFEAKILKEQLKLVNKLFQLIKEKNIEL